jgi:hypothetical protein
VVSCRFDARAAGIVAEKFPAATFLSALPLGMLLAAELYRRLVGCAKLHHENNKRCIHCGKPKQV